MIVDAFTYLKATQRLLREQKQEFENPGDPAQGPKMGIGGKGGA